MNKTRKSTAATLIVCTFIFCLFATSRLFSADAKKSGVFKELRDEIHNYAGTNVLPSLKTWKTQLDNAMTKDDLAKLNDLRAQAKDLRTQMRQEMMKLRQDVQNGSADKQEIKDAREQNKEQMMALAKQVKPLAEKYKSTLVSIGATAKPKLEEWKAQIKDIVQTWKTNHKDMLDSMKSNHPNWKPGEFGHGFGMGMMGNEMDKKRMVVRFMLWDGSDDVLNELNQPMTGDNMGKNFIGGNAAIVNSQSYPNPFKTNTTISVTLPSEANGMLYICDDAGNIIEKIYEGNFKSGENNFVFTPSDKYSNGAYFYKLKTGKYSASGKIVYQK